MRSQRAQGTLTKLAVSESRFSSLEYTLIQLDLKATSWNQGPATSAGANRLWSLSQTGSRKHLCRCSWPGSPRGPAVPGTLTSVHSAHWGPIGLKEPHRLLRWSSTRWLWSWGKWHRDGPQGLCYSPVFHCQSRELWDIVCTTLLLRPGVQRRASRSGKHRRYSPKSSRKLRCLPWNWRGQMSSHCWRRHTRRLLDAGKSSPCHPRYLRSPLARDPARWPPAAQGRSSHRRPVKSHCTPSCIQLGSR